MKFWETKEHPTKEDVFIIFKEERMNICIRRVYKNKIETAQVITLEKSKTGEVQKIIGMCLREDDIHYVTEGDMKKVESFLRKL